MTPSADDARFPARGPIPDASDPCWRDPAWQGAAPPPLPPRKPSPYPQGWWPGDPPVEYLDDSLGHEPGLGPARAGDRGVFDAAARVRFLDCLATVGEVRAAAARVGVSRETAYRARRRYADFARLWDAALLHARARAEGELATRALDGVKVPVFVRGEHVATYRRHDARYLFALLARLDRRAAESPAAAEAAERFDELLALHLGHEAPEDFADAAGAGSGGSSRADEGEPRVPTREQYAAWSGEQSVLAIEGEGEEAELLSEEEEGHVRATGAAHGAAVWVDWRHEALARVDAAIAGPPADDAPGGLPCEVKSHPPRARLRGVSQVSHLSLAAALGAPRPRAGVGPGILPPGRTHL